VSGHSAAFTLGTDYSAPDSSALSISGVTDDVGTVTGELKSGDSTDDTLPVIHGTGTAGDTVEVFTTVNGVKSSLGTATVGDDGKWSLQVDAAHALQGGVNVL
ncbi:Ig-like domain-containing protein, partial [Enterobacter cloacae]|uniref:Ig-like domain-containing protein n=1 Tax=Enterobacter cloacae TaxID=550 RepID=UPI0021CFDBD8